MLILKFALIVFIPIIKATNEPSDILHKTVQESHGVISNNSLLSEGGLILPDELTDILPKKNQSMFIKLGKVTDRKGKPVVARKGVQFNSSENSAVETIESKEETMFAQVKNSKINNTLSIDTNSNEHPKTNISNINKQSTTNMTKAHKKPMVLSFEALEKINSVNILKSSPQSTVSDQLQSPNKNYKKYISNTNKHPEIVMPVVITILTVPMFAVLGYMALKRGQEAWKNRHYKRMDFLLDGMYND